MTSSSLLFCYSFLTVLEARLKQIMNCLAMSGQDVPSLPSVLSSSGKFHPNPSSSCFRPVHTNPNSALCQVSLQQQSPQEQSSQQQQQQQLIWSTYLDKSVLSS